MIVPIYTYGEEVLRKKSTEIDLEDPMLPQIITNMKDTMRNTNLSVAIAAPQIGISKRIFIIEGDQEDFQLDYNVFINPKIFHTEGYLHNFIEPCLSFPDFQINVKRPTIVGIEWYDEDKKYHKEFFTDMSAKIIQHEEDHLNGILIIDRADPEELIKYKPILDRIMKKKIKTSHPIFNNSESKNKQT